MATVIADVETYKNFFYIGFLHLESGRRIGFELSDRSPTFDRKRVSTIMKKNLIVTFNGASYDIPMITLALDGVSNFELKRASDRIIKTGLKPWTVAAALRIQIPEIDHIDLIEPVPSVMQGLKTLNGRLHGLHMADLPHHPDAVLTEDEMDDNIVYNGNDLDATALLFKAMREPLELRSALSEQYGVDMRSKSDAQIGETIVRTRVQQMTGKRAARDSDAIKGTTFRYDPPSFMRFRTPQLQDIFDQVCSTTFEVRPDGKVSFPKAFEKLKIHVGSSVYKMGIGGLHSTEANRSVHSDDENVLVDVDVAGQYPRIIMTLGLYPPALGKSFLDVYNGIIVERLIAKQKKDKVRDQGGKIAVNGVYGKLGSPYSVVYAPHLMIAVTLTGQLSLLMLIEAAELAGIPVVSANTDGVIFNCPREFFNGFVLREDGSKTERLAPSKLAEIVERWETVTDFTMEAASYRSLYNSSVNSYVAIKDDGSVKLKGPIANPWATGDLRGQMMKNPQMTICSDAVVAYLTKGTPVEETIRACTDIRSFVTVVKVTGGATWRDGYLGKVVRFIWSIYGEPILYSIPHPKTGNFKKVSKSDGSRPVMTLPDALPSDIDYERYIEEARTMLVDLGAGDPRATQQMSLIQMAVMALAA